MSHLVQSVDVQIQERRHFRKGQPILVAVSGGVDSMVLLEILFQLAPAYGWRLTVAHLDHGLRGRSSRADARFVENIAARRGIDSVIDRADVQRLAAASGISIEMAARQLRHEFLARAARERNISSIALAHHADDQVELFFLRLLRGAGGMALGGMRHQSPSPADPRRTLVRPLLEFSKEQLTEFARAEGIRFREDATNHSLDILRNRVRGELIPLLTNIYQPALRKVILRQMNILGTEAEFMEGLAREWLGSESESESGRGSSRSGSEFGHLSPALQRQILRSGLIRLGVEFDYDLVEQLRGVAGRSIMVAPGVVLARDKGGRIQRSLSATGAFSEARQELELGGLKGRGRFGGVDWSWELHETPARVLPGSLEQVEWFDADRVGSAVVLRHWRRGDRYQPTGLPAAVKLQDLFSNLKVPRAERHARLVAASVGGEIWWVEGLRIAERFKLSRETKRRLRWSWHRRAAA